MDWRAMGLCEVSAKGVLLRVHLMPRIPLTVGLVWMKTRHFFLCLIFFLRNHRRKSDYAYTQQLWPLSMEMLHL
jgi:hypothetical protein